ncbi:MAG: GntR family transcriptional regulator [Pseudomonadota bacterium]
MATKDGFKIPVEPIEHEPLHERLYISLRKSIMSGQFSPGQKLTVRGLAEAFGTSPMPVRASLSRLVAEGGLIQRENGTIILPPMNKKTFMEVMEMRAVLEKMATIKACHHMDQAAFKDLRAKGNALASAAKKNDITEYLEVNRKLKFTIYRQADSQVLFSIIEKLWLQAGPFLRHLAGNLKGIMQINYHEDAFRLLKEGKAEQAGEEIARDILAGMECILQTSIDWEDINSVN